MFLRVPDKVIWAELPEKPLQSVPDKEASKWKTYAGDSDMFKGPWFLKLNCFKYLQCTVVNQLCCGQVVFPSEACQVKPLELLCSDLKNLTWDVGLEPDSSGLSK